MLYGLPAASFRPLKKVLLPQLAAVWEKSFAEQLSVVTVVTLPHPFGVFPVLTHEELGKLAVSYGSSYIEVELSSTSTTLGSWPDCEAKKVTSPLSSVLTVVGWTRLLTALFARQSPGLQDPAASAGRGASKAASSIASANTSAGRRSRRSRIALLTVRTGR